MHRGALCFLWEWHSSSKPNRPGAKGVFQDLEHSSCKEISVHRSPFACCFLAISLSLSGCGILSGDSDRQDTDEAAQQARWSEASVKQLRQAIDRRAVHALDRLHFEVEGQPDTAAGQEALTRSALRYAKAVAQGASDPAKLFTIYTVPGPSPDLHRGLAEALRKDKLGEWLDGLAPRDVNYTRLSRAYLALRNQSEAAGADIPNTAVPLKPGATDPRVPAIARQLVASDYLDPSSAQGDGYSPAIVRAVKHMQADYGIKPDGVIGKEALEILNLSDAERARALAVAMERMRWLDENAPPTRIDVNLASARLTYWRDGKVADMRKVVVGKPDAETPQLGSPIHRLVANPTWTVPRSIQNKEIEGKGAGYLRRNNMTWKDGWIVQQPGPRNSLGLVKFDMKNEHEIYLHDTPAKQLFKEAQRQRSHGCVRVEDAVGFATMLARDEGILDEWQKARRTGKESFVPLPREIPVRLFYQTVLFDDTGEPVIRADPYGWNDRVAAAIGFPANESPLLHPSASDMGP
ncbi:L,D-transpeptidase family protein [Croceibacterium sp. LX-88]|uniref:L,D-transpeptidase family protein n=1 Tax=Croceibacterium selenioxidans TaxID=2838833 RepID=A0ABS5W3E5_9SPHN|nr:L,D-transpeptidase family protein [Croceibacterium selenioxidans]